MHQHIESFSARGRHGGVGCSRGTHIAGRDRERAGPSVDGLETPDRDRAKRRSYDEGDDRSVSSSPGRGRHPSRPVHTCAASRMQCRGASHQVAIGSAQSRSWTRPHRLDDLGAVSQAQTANHSARGDNLLTEHVAADLDTERLGQARRAPPEWRRSHPSDTKRPRVFAYAQFRTEPRGAAGADPTYCVK